MISVLQQNTNAFLHTFFSSWFTNHLSIWHSIETCY